MNEEKEVYFDQYCKSCKYHGLEESKDPCNDCLAEPGNTNSHKPMNYESKKQFLIPRKRMRLILQQHEVPTIDYTTSVVNKVACDRVIYQKGESNVSKI